MRFFVVLVLHGSLGAFDHLRDRVVRTETGLRLLATKLRLHLE